MYSNYRALKNKRQIGFTCYILIEPGQLQVPFPEKKALKIFTLQISMQEVTHWTHIAVLPLPR